MTLTVQTLHRIEIRDMSRDDVANYRRLQRESRIARRILREALRASYSISVNDGEETTLVRSTKLSAIIEAMATTDEDWIFLHRADQSKRATWDQSGTKDCAGWVRLIYGNDTDLISDYSANEAIEALMGPAQEYADSLYV